MQTATVRDLLDHMLARTVDSLGAHAGVLVLPEPGTDVLVVDASVGLPPECVAPLCRIRPADEPADLVAEAIHRRQPVWVGSGEELAGRLPPGSAP